ncbi:MAG: hypothetical protein FWE33_02700 [Defluviitaleaceae bacterium]|nr:hypothetical protein [Defluviitaleaceae bacterium]
MKKDFPDPKPISAAVVSTNDFTGIKDNDPYLDMHLNKQMQKSKPHFSHKT